LAGQAFANTTVAGAAGMMTWVLMEQIVKKPSSAVGACNGVIGKKPTDVVVMM
jgi:ammonia channel protein AmtB